MAGVQRRNSYNGHAHEVGPTPGDAQCPYCGAPISRKQFRDIRERIEAEERARVAKVEIDLKARFERAQRQAAATAKAEFAARETAIRKNAAETAAASITAKIAEAVAMEKQRAYAEKLALEQQLADMQRRLQSKPAHQIGEPAEQELHAAIVAACCPEDRVERVARGVKGADIVIEVVHQGADVGRIIVDSKAHSRWSRRFTTKLRADQLAADADFAILSSSIMPTVARGIRLHILDGIIVADPALVPALISLLRSQVVQNHVLRLGTADRDQKADRLYGFIISPTCSDLLNRIIRATSDLNELDRSETTAHQRVWTKRGDLIRSVQSAHSEFTAAVGGIIAGDNQ